MRKINIDPKWLEEQYITNIRDANDMAKDIGCSGNTIRMKLEEIGINRRLQCIYKKGHEVTDETKEKISKNHNPKSDLNLTHKNKKSKEKYMNIIKRKMESGYIPIIAGWWKDKNHTEEHNNKISQSRKSSLLCRGENSPNWQGGISFEPYSIQFNRELKELIRQRDNYQCQICGMPEVENIHQLDIHHIDYNKKNCLPSNLISLCRGCHMKTNYDREYWMEYFNSKK